MNYLDRAAAKARADNRRRVYMRLVVEQRAAIATMLAHPTDASMAKVAMLGADIQSAYRAWKDVQANID